MILSILRVFKSKQKIGRDAIFISNFFLDNEGSQKLTRNSTFNFNGVNICKACMLINLSQNCGFKMIYFKSHLSNFMLSREVSPNVVQILSVFSLLPRA